MARLRTPGVVSVQHIEKTDIHNVTIPKSIRLAMDIKPQEKLRFEVAVADDGNKFLKLFRFFPETTPEPQPA